MDRKKRAPGAGRKPKGEFAGKSANFSTRITQELRDALDRESERTGKSISQIVELRLRESFDEPKRMQRELGDDHVRALAYTVARLAIRIERTTGRKWHEDPYTFAMVRSALMVVMGRVAPDGEMDAPEIVRREKDRLERAVATKPGEFDFMIDPDAYGKSFGNVMFEMVLASMADDLGQQMTDDPLLHFINRKIGIAKSQIFDQSEGKGGKNAR